MIYHAKKNTRWKAGKIVSKKNTLLWSRPQAMPGEKLDKPVNLKKSIKTGRPDSPVAPGELTGLSEILTKIIYTKII